MTVNKDTLFGSLKVPGNCDEVLRRGPGVEKKHKGLHSSLHVKNEGPYVVFFLISGFDQLRSCKQPAGHLPK
jgi:hypothetical protein